MLIILYITCLKFLGEVSAGRACAVANEEELTICKKNWGQEGGGKGGKGVEKRGTRKCKAGGQWSQATDRAPTSRRLPLVSPNQATVGRLWSPGPLWAATGGRPSAAAEAAYPDRPLFFFLISNFFFNFFFRPLHVARAWASLGGCIYNSPNF
jgi:hypothetical protein